MSTAISMTLIICITLIIITVICGVIAITIMKRVEKFPDKKNIENK